ncbi:IclR-like helix-turn-helix domain-containing protein [Streptomyces sp. T12]|uniref:helix-turn-helix domain-containing protein n=1 Tax=Streptomyces sp. T12 TaxID=477697 RepID=UPI0011ACD18E|nr:helix-turn-helix domain-containing protein [Streptomyces sp. T12]TWD13523.1 IclR-like helix-turn-helix domain-containing protein [Streptomyces sp. T12]
MTKSFMNPGFGTRTEPAGVVASAFAVLRVLSQTRTPVGVTFLASEVGIPKTTAHRLLEQMAAEGVVERRERRWSLGPGIQDLARSVHPTPLVAAAQPRLEAMSKATGATLFLHHYFHHSLEEVSSAYGSQVGRLVSVAEQELAVRHPSSALWRALKSGELSTEYREVRPECNCMAVSLPLPMDSTAVLSLARPVGAQLEDLKRPMQRMASLIHSDLRRLTG